jgi:hypothetical protein
MDQDATLRKQLLVTLQGKGAHMTFDEAVADFPMDMVNLQPLNVNYTPWHLVEHLRLAQWDILDYIRNPDYEARKWPDDYWPAPDARADADAWEKSLADFRRDLQELEAIVQDPATDLYAPIPHGYGGHTILREILLVADHNAYHVGELAILRQIMGAWLEDRGG